MLKLSERKFHYDSLEDAQRRLLGTVVMYDGDPVFIDNIRGLSRDQIADITVLPYNAIRKEVKLLVKNFQVLDLPPLGYINYGNFSHYLTRVPVRQIRQGLCAQNVMISQNPDGKNPTFDQMMRHQSMVDMFKNRYPHFDECWERLLKADEPFKIAFGKKFAVSIDDMESVTLECRGINVARSNNPRKYGPRFALPKKFEYLAEELQENAIRTE
jgi:hypothetical protein